MNLHEYQSKSILKQYGVAGPEGALAYTEEEAVKAAEAAHSQELLVLRMDAETEKRLSELKIKTLEDTAASPARLRDWASGWKRPRIRCRTSLSRR